MKRNARVLTGAAALAAGICLGTLSGNVDHPNGEARPSVAPVSEFTPAIQNLARRVLQLADQPPAGMTVDRTGKPPRSVGLNYTNSGNNHYTVLEQAAEVGNPNTVEALQLTATHLGETFLNVAMFKDNEGYWSISLQEPSKSGTLVNTVAVDSRQTNLTNTDSVTLRTATSHDPAYIAYEVANVINIFDKTLAPAANS